MPCRLYRSHTQVSYFTSFPCNSWGSTTLCTSNSRSRDVKLSDRIANLSGAVFFCKSQRMDAVTAAPSHGWMALVPRLQLTGVWSRGCMAELKSQDGLMTHGGGIFSSSISVDRFVHPSFFCSSHLVLSWSTYRRPRYESFLIKIHQNPMNLYEASVPTISSKHFQ